MSKKFIRFKLESKALNNQYGIGGKKIEALIVDESIIKIGSEFMGFGLTLNLKINEFLKLVHNMSKTCSLQGVIASLVKGFGRHQVFT